MKKSQLIPMNIQHFASSVSGQTKIADVIVPEVFNNYMVERTAELSALVSSGIISQDAELDALASSGGKLIHMPFWNDLTGEDQIFTDKSAITVKKIDSNKDIAVLLTRANAWGSHDLAASLSGSDPQGAIAELVAAWWARREQATLLSILEGVFKSPSMSGNQHDVSAASAPAESEFTGPTFIDAKTKLGDAADKLTAIMVHSATMASLQKQNLIVYVPNSQGVVNIPTYMGVRVIVDDGCPKSGSGTDTIYTSYLFGAGAIGRGEGSPEVPTEVDRDSLGSTDILINRRQFLLHPRGVKFTSSKVADVSPTNAELKDGDNWTRVYENKNIRMVQFIHKLK